jgi:DNA-binding winged helix-turn-helix (wHTH) protein/predicted ATPase
MATARQITFGPFRLDVANECLWRGSQAIALRPKAFAVLRCLVEASGNLVTKEQLLDAVWPGTFVGDAVLKDSVRQLREALGDEAHAPRYIETAHRRGYRFIGHLAGETAPASPEPPAETAAAAPPDVAAPAPARVLGREAALARMWAWLDHALGGERQVVFVTGEAGIGKTTLVEAFLDQATAVGRVWIARGQCLEQYGAGEAYLPVLDGLSRLCRGPGGERVVDLLRQHAPTWLVQMPRLVAAADREALQQQALGATRERMLREMADALEALTAERPLVLVLEDLHWSDYSTLDLVSYLARRRDPARLMAIGTYRPVEVVLGEHPLRSVKRELQAHRLCSELPVEYLAEETVAQFLDLRFPRNRFPARLARLIHQRTEGNPLFMVNVVDFLLDEGIIAERDGWWLLDRDPADVEPGVPENIRHLIEKQIERLSPDEQRVLEAASVVGVDCSTVAIAAGLDEDVANVEEWCEELVRRHQFLSPPRVVELPDGTPTPRYRFNHSVYVDVPYSRIPAMRRAQIHRRIGEAGEAIYGDRVGEIAAELAMHFEQGRDWPRAVRYLQQAAGNAADRSAHYEAVALARRGLQVLEMLPESPERDQQELALRLTLGASLMTTRGFAASELEEIFERARELCGPQGPSLQLYSVLWSLGLYRIFRAELEPARATAEQLLELGEGLGDPALVMEAHRALGVTHVDLGEFAGGLEHLDRAAALYRKGLCHDYTYLTAYDSQVVSRCFAARALWALGYPDRALAAVGEATELARELRHTPSIVVAAYFGAHVHELRREAAAARERAEAVLALSREHGLELWAAFGLVFRGWADGDVDELRGGLAAYEATGARLWRTHALGLLAGTLGASGRVEEGLAVVDEALALAGATGERYDESQLHRTKGELLTMRADPELDRAEACYREAIEVARRQGAKSCELRATVALARLERRRGGGGDARALLGEVYGRFTEGFETEDLTDARRLLDELPRSATQNRPR